MQNTGRASDSRQWYIEHRISHSSLIAFGIRYSPRHFEPMFVDNDCDIKIGGDIVIAETEPQTFSTTRT